jgi:hypothetical protein
MERQEIETTEVRRATLAFYSGSSKHPSNRWDVVVNLMIVGANEHSVVVYEVFEDDKLVFESTGYTEAQTKYEEIEAKNL